MLRNRTRSCAVVALSAALLSGCVFQRSVVNEQTQDLDLSFIRVGTTTWEDVLENLGPPDVPIKNLRLFQYKHAERRTTGFTIRYFLFLPWTWYDEQVEDMVTIELDERGVVSHVGRSRHGTIRPPLEGEESRPKLESETIGGGKA